MNITSLVRSEIITMRGYEVVEQAIHSIKMNKNENPWAGVNLIKDLQLNRYPDSQPANLLHLIRHYYEVEEGDLFLTRGSDEAIDLIIRLFCRPYTDSILIMTPTFGMYEIYGQINSIQINKVPLQDNSFALDWNALQDDQVQRNKVVFICSPNNPTGNLISVNDIEALCILFSKSVVVVDEAYIDFSSGDSCLSLLKEYQHLIVLRTLSKSFGLAGIRCGIIFASEQILYYLKKIAAPYTMNALSLYAATQCFGKSKIKKIQNRIKLIKREREKLSIALQRLNKLFSRVWPSEANFILVESWQAQELLDYCLCKNIMLRGFNGSAHLKDCLRISIGSPDDNDELLAVLNSYCLSRGLS